jgi:hypothetical protein
MDGIGTSKYDLDLANPPDYRFDGMTQADIDYVFELSKIMYDDMMEQVRRGE